MALSQAEGANSQTQTELFQERTGDLFFTSTQSPSGEPSWSNADIIKILIKTV